MLCYNENEKGIKMKNINKMIKEFENMPKEDLVRSIRVYCPNLNSAILECMSPRDLATMVACSILLDEIEKLKDTQRDLIRLYRSELASDMEKIEYDILVKLIELSTEYQNLFSKAMQEYYKSQNEEDAENEKRIREILEKHRKRMNDELNKKVRKEREERIKEEERQREAQRKGVQCSDDEELIM